MTEKPLTFDIKFDSAGDFDKARELIERMNAELAAKDRRIAELESEWRVREGYHQKLWNDASDKIHALEARIDRVRALADRIEGLSVMTPSQAARLIRAALGEPAATPERWRCETCGSEYAEYVNGCPHCWEAEIRSKVLRVIVPAATPKERP